MVRVIVVSVICSMWNVGVWLIFLLLGCAVEGLFLLSVPLWQELRGSGCVCPAFLC